MKNYKTDTPECLREFLSYMSTIKGRSENTVLSYYNDLKMFFRFLKQKHNLIPSGTAFNEIKIADTPEEIIRSVTLYDAMEFLHYMSSDRHNSPRARARRAVAMRQFYKFLTNNKLWYTSSPLDKLELPSPKAALPKHLTIEQALALLKAPSSAQNATDEVTEARDYCILTLFLNCGMRLSELTGLNVNDYKRTIMPGYEDGIHTLKVLGKGNKERIIYLNQACVLAYERYMEARALVVRENQFLQHEKALFLSAKHRRISGRRVQQIIENALKTAGLDGMGFSVHKLRHTAATLMYQNGVDVRVLKEILGHENLNTTQIYTHVANQQMIEAMKNNPLSDELPPESAEKKQDEA